MTKAEFVALATIIALAGPTSAQSRSRVQINHTVSYGDLDLGSSSGRAALDRRLQEAIWAVCGKPDASHLGDLDEFNDWQQCLSEAKASAAKGRAFALGRSVARKNSRIYRESSDRTSSSDHVMVYSVQRSVNFADLDLRSAKGVHDFMERIRYVAKEGCDQLSKEDPLVRDDSCVETAVDNAVVQANQVIDAANR